MTAAYPDVIGVGTVPGRLSYRTVRRYHAVPRRDGVVTYRAGARLTTEEWRTHADAADHARAIAHAHGLGWAPVSLHGAVAAIYFDERRVVRVAEGGER